MLVAEKLPRPLRGPIQAVASQPIVRLGLTLFDRFSDHDVPGRSAEMAYRFLFALFPFLIFVAALVGFVGARIGYDDLFNMVMAQISRLVPPEIATVVSDLVAGVLSTQSTSLLTIGAAGALYGAAGGVNTLRKGLNRAHDVVETRAFWKRQAMGMLTILTLAFFMLGGVFLFTIGESLGDWLASHFGGEIFKSVWDLLTGPVLVVGLCIVLVALYRVLPNTSITIVQAIPGALLATAAWVVLTLGFSFYLTHFGGFQDVFGSMGTAVVLMVWMNLVAMILLIGGEIGALIASSAVKETAGDDTEAGTERPLEEMKESA